MSEFDQQIARALGHPLRLEILRLLEEGPSGPKRLADRSGEQLSNVSYHTRVLFDCGCIELLETIPARGALEHIYKLKPQGAIGSGNWKALPPALQTHYAGSALAGLASRAVEAMDAGTFESREGSGISWFPLSVDEEGWKELRRVLRNVDKRFRAVGNKSAERLQATGENATSVIVAVGAFEVAKKKGPSTS